MKGKPIKSSKNTNPKKMKIITPMRTKNLRKNSKNYC